MPSIPSHISQPNFLDSLVRAMAPPPSRTRPTPPSSSMRSSPPPAMTPPASPVPRASLPSQGTTSDAPSVQHATTASGTHPYVEASLLVEDEHGSRPYTSSSSRYISATLYFFLILGLCWLLSFRVGSEISFILVFVLSSLTKLKGPNCLRYEEFTVLANILHVT